MKTMILVMYLAPMGWLPDSNETYVNTMMQTIGEVYNATDPKGLQETINKLDRIAAAEPDKWEPYYYKAYASIMVGVMTEKSVEKDQWYEQALEAVRKGREIAPAEAELVALRGFALMMKVAVNPEVRGPEYSPLAMQAFGQALGMDEGNPRALYLMANMQLGMAQFFGQGPEEACGTLQKAIESFSTYKSENPLAPQWGQAQAEAMQENCK